MSMQKKDFSRFLIQNQINVTLTKCSQQQRIMFIKSDRSLTLHLFILLLENVEEIRPIGIGGIFVVYSLNSYRWILCLDKLDLVPGFTTQHNSFENPTSDKLLLNYLVLLLILEIFTFLLLDFQAGLLQFISSFFDFFLSLLKFFICLLSLRNMPLLILRRQLFLIFEPLLQSLENSQIFFSISQYLLLLFRTFSLFLFDGLLSLPISLPPIFQIFLKRVRQALHGLPT